MMGNLLLLPVLLPLAGAGAGWLMRGKGRKGREALLLFVNTALFLVAASAFAFAARGGRVSLTLGEVCGTGLHLKLDGFRALFLLTAAFLWLMTTLFSREDLRALPHRARYDFFNGLTCAAVMGVFLAADLLTVFVFFEVLSLASCVLVLAEETRESLRAGATYAAVAVAGGLITLMGLFLLYARFGTLDMDEMYRLLEEAPDRSGLYLPAVLTMTGFAAKACLFPLHFWLSDSYRESPAPATALLSGILTKAGVFGLLAVACSLFRSDPLFGRGMLLAGLITMVWGGVCALLAVDMKRILAGSSMSQIGFIVTGIGMLCIGGEEGGTAAWGTVLHMLNHSLLKLVLFLAAGVVLRNLGTLNLNEIRGFGRGKPLFAFAFLTAYLGLIGMPLLNGYVSKTLLHESMVEEIELLPAAGLSAGFFHAAEWVFLFSGGLTAAYMTKLAAALFLEKPGSSRAGSGADTAGQPAQKTYLDPAGRAALALPAVILLLLGLFPQVFSVPLAGMGEGFLHAAAPAERIRFFSAENLRGAVISLSIGAVLYFGVVRTMLMRRNAEGTKVYEAVIPARVSFENLFWRPAAARFLPAALGRTAALCDALPEAAFQVLLTLTAAVCRFASLLTEQGARLVTDHLLKPFRIPDRDPADFERGEVLGKTQEDRLRENLTGRLSFGFLLFGLGFCATMLYLIAVLLS